MNRLLLLSTTLLLALGCSPLSSEDVSKISGDELQDEPGDTDAGGEDTGVPIVEPEFWSIDGLLVVNEAGEIEPDLSSVTVGYWTRSEELCSTVVGVTSAVAEELDPDVPLYGWWRMTFGTPEGCEMYPSMFADLNLGVGAWDTRLEPAADSQGLDVSDAYAVYLKDSAVVNAPVFVYGVSIQEPETVLVSEPPLPPGEYSIRGLHLLPL